MPDRPTGSRREDAGRAETIEAVALRRADAGDDPADAAPAPPLRRREDAGRAETIEAVALRPADRADAGDDPADAALAPPLRRREDTGRAVPPTSPGSPAVDDRWAFRFDPPSPTGREPTIEAPAIVVGPNLEAAPGSGDASDTPPQAAAAPPRLTGREPTIEALPAVVIDPTLDASPDPEAPSAARTSPQPADAPTGPTPSALSTASLGDTLHDVRVTDFATIPRERFEILEEHARGGLGRIFRARDPHTGRVVALKEVLAPSPGVLLRFAREALVTANLQHPAIVPVYEVGRWPSGEPFYAMKLVRGETLARRVAEARDAAERVALLPHVIDVAEALAYAHSEGVIHRDLKPDNVIVGAYGETVVIDWGLARSASRGEADAASPEAVVDAVAGETVAGGVVGTPAYMPPEQAAGAPIDARADVYSLGAMLYHVLAGRRPYADDGGQRILRAVRQGPPEPLAALAPDVPAELVAIADKAMARRPEARYADAAELADDLRRFLAGQLVAAHRYTTWQLVRRWVARHRAAVATAAVALVALAVAGALGVQQIAAERDEAERQRAVAEEARGEAEGQRALAEVARIEAEDQRAVAEARHAESLEELGRQALVVASDAGQALPLLARAASLRRAPSPSLALLGGQARAAYAGLEAVAPPHGRRTTAAALTPDGRRLISASIDGEVRAWDLDAGAVAWREAGEITVALSPVGDVLLGVVAPDTLSLRAASDGAERARWVADLDDGEALVILTWDEAGARFAAATSTGRVVVGAPAPGTPGGMAVALAAASHRDGVNQLAFSPDGRHVASVGADGVALVHDAGAGGLVDRLTDGDASFNDGAWLDDARLVVMDGAGAARVWRVADGAVLARFAHRDGYYGLHVDRAAGAVALYGGPVVARFDAATGALLAELGGHGLGVSQVVTAGRWLVVADDVGRVHVWDPSLGARVRELPAEGRWATLAARGSRLVTYGAGQQRVWDLDAPPPLRAVHHHTARVRAVAFDPRGEVVWSASNDGTARGTDITGATTPRVLGEASFEEAAITHLDGAAAADPNPRGLRSLTVSPDGAVVATASEDSALILWDARSGAVRARLEGHTGRARRLVFAPDGRQAYSVGGTTLRRWDVAAAREIGRVELGADAWDVALLGAGVVVTTTEEQRLALWDAETLASIPSEVEHNRLRDLVVDGARLIVATRTHLGRIDARGTLEIAVLHDNALTASLSRGADGASRLAVGDPALVTVYDAESLEPLRSWPGGVTTMATFRPDGGVLATASGRRALIWAPGRGQLLAQTPELPMLISQLAWSPDGRRLAIAGGGGGVWVWSLEPADAVGLSALARCVTPAEVGDAASPSGPDACRDL